MSDGSIVIINKFPAKCRVCGKPVPALTGIAIKDGACKWQSAHYECESVLSAPILEARKLKRDKFLAEQKVQEEAKAAKAARRVSLLEKTRLDLSSEVQVSSCQGAYCDSFLSYFLFHGEATIEELRELLVTPPQSSAGQLRWSNGRMVVRVEGNKVFVSESISMCD